MNQYKSSIFRLVNRIQTFEDFGQHWRLVNLELVKDFLDQRKEEEITIFTCSHINMGQSGRPVWQTLATRSRTLPPTSSLLPQWRSEWTSSGLSKWIHKDKYCFVRQRSQEEDKSL